MYSNKFIIKIHSISNLMLFILHHECSYIFNINLVKVCII